MMAFCHYFARPVKRLRGPGPTPSARNDMVAVARQTRSRSVRSLSAESPRRHRLCDNCRFALICHGASSCWRNPEGNAPSPHFYCAWGCFADFQPAASPMKKPGLANETGPFGLATCSRSAAGARADHEAVVSVFGHLPPQIFVGAVRLHGVDRLLEVGVLGRDLAP